MSPASPRAAGVLPGSPRLASRGKGDEVARLWAENRLMQALVDALASKLRLSNEELAGIAQEVAKALLLCPGLLDLSDDLLLCIAQYLDLNSCHLLPRVCTRLHRVLSSMLPKTEYMRRACTALMGVPDDALNVPMERRWQNGNPVVFAMKAHKGSITSLARASENIVVSASDDGSLVCWNLGRQAHALENKALFMHHHLQSREGHRMHALQGHGGAVWCVAADKGVVVSGSYDKTIKVWNLNSGDCRTTLRGHESWVSSVAMDVDQDLVLSGGWDATIRAWSISRSVVRLSLPTTPGNAVYALHWNKRTGLVAAGNSFVEIYDLNSARRVASFEAHAAALEAQARCYAVKQLAHSLVISGGSDSLVKLWDIRTPGSVPQAVLTGHTKSVMGLDVCESRPFRVVSCSLDRLVCVFDLRIARGEPDMATRYLGGGSQSPRSACLYSLAAHGSPVFTCMADKDKILSGGEDTILRVFRFD